jgi:hypothetical protein
LKLDYLNKTYEEVIIPQMHIFQGDSGRIKYSIDKDNIVLTIQKPYTDGELIF